MAPAPLTFDKIEDSPSPLYFWFPHHTTTNKGQKRSHSSANKGRQQRTKEGVTVVPFSKAGSAAVLWFVGFLVSISKIQPLPPAICDDILVIRRRPLVTCIFTKPMHHNQDDSQLCSFLQRHKLCVEMSINLRVFYFYAFIFCIGHYFIF